MSRADLIATDQRQPIMLETENWKTENKKQKTQAKMSRAHLNATNTCFGNRRQKTEKRKIKKKN